MADGLGYDPGTLATVLTDDTGAGGHAQVVKLAYGADGSATQAQLDADGLLVNLGANNDVTVTGTVDLGATDNAVLDDIAAKLGTIDADTSALAGAVGGTELQVDVVAALPAGTNAIGKLAANSGVDIGDVDVTSVVPGTGATALGKAVDDAAGATDTGIAMLAVRADTPATLTPVDGDYVLLRVGAKGHLWTRQENMWDSATAIQVSSSITAGTPVTLHTPASGKKFRVIAMALMQSGANVRILLKYGGSSSTFLTVPATRYGTAESLTHSLWRFPPNGIAPGAANDALKLDIHTGSGVNVTGTIWVIEE